jgi:hypothetical protein
MFSLQHLLSPELHVTSLCQQVGNVLHSNGLRTSDLGSNNQYVPGISDEEIQGFLEIAFEVFVPLGCKRDNVSPELAPFVQGRAEGRPMSAQGGPAHIPMTFAEVAFATVLGTYSFSGCSWHQ